LSRQIERTSWATRRRRRDLGLTMAEMLVAIFVVAVGVLGTVSALWYGIRSEKYSQRRSNAVFQAQEILNQIKASGMAFDSSYTDPGGELNDGDYDDNTDDADNQRDFNDPPFANYFPQNPYNFRRHVETKILSSDTNSHLNRMAGIKVTILWDEGTAERKVTLWSVQRRP